MALKTPVGDAPVIPVVGLLVGGYLAWFGIHYWRQDVKWPSDPVKGVLTGKGAPASNPPASHLAELDAEVSGASATEAQIPGGQAPAPPTPGGPGSVTGQQIASDALLYKGQGYVWGGHGSAPGDWDCSSFVSYVLGHDLGFQIPGGSWSKVTANGTQHGPTTLDYMLYGTSVNLDKIAPGDLIVSVEHIGICIGNGQMISAQDPQDGTGVAGFPSGFPAGPPIYRRVTSARVVPGEGTGTTQAPGTNTAGGRG